MEGQKIFRIISSFAVLIPIAIALYKFNKSNFIYRLFLLFLAYGFTTDMLCWYFFTHDHQQAAQFLFNFYSLIEFLFYFYFLTTIGTLEFINRFKIPIYAIFILAWMYIYIGNSSQQVTLSGIYNATYEVLFVIMSAIVLLKYVETHNRIAVIPEFWFAAAIFFYCINVFFIFQLISSSLVQKIWFIQNIVNIITSFFLAAGFSMIGKPIVDKISSSE